MAKGVGGKKKLKFTTKARVNASRRRKWTIAFVIVVIIIAIASLLTYFKEKPLEKTDVDDSTGVSSFTNMKENVGILFAGTKTDGGEVLILVHLAMNTEDKSFTVTPLPASEISSVKGSDIVKDVSKKFGLNTDRYVLINEKQIKHFIGALGLYDTDIKEKIRYSGDGFSLNLQKGQQTLTGDKFFRYLQYAGAGELDSALKRQGEIVADLIVQKINAANCAKGEDLFEVLINSSESDITIVDFQKYKGFFEEVSTQTRNVTVKLITEE